MSSRLIVRRAERQDCYAIFSLKKELALHSNMSGPMLSPKELERDGFDTSPPCYECLVAEEIISPDNGLGSTEETRRVIGYALYYVIYPVWEGKGLLLEDLCVSKELRGRGAGQLLLEALAKIGVEGNYSRITLECLNTNPTQSFYKKNYGIDVTASEGWHLFRFGTSALHKLAEKDEL